MATISRQDFIKQVTETASDCWSIDGFDGTAFENQLTELVTQLTGPDVVTMLAEQKGDQTLETFASSINCSTSYVSDVLNGQKPPGPKIYHAVGIEKPTKRWR